MTKQSSLILAVAAYVSMACAGGQEARDATVTSDPNVVHVTAQAMQFHVQESDTIPSGWTTFEFMNPSDMVHMAVLERFPEGHGAQDLERAVAPVFLAGMKLLDAGKPDSAMKVFGTLPDWYANVRIVGGPGLTSPGHTTSATVRLEPGTYVIECYVKTNGIFHSSPPDLGGGGMVHEFTVTADSSDLTPPSANATLTLSSANGIALDGQLAPGQNTVAVHFADQKVYSNFVGHDVHVVRLADSTDVAAVNAWMDWTRKGGLDTPAPATFVGGLNEMPADSTGFFTVSLKPGRYAFVSEVPDPRAKNMFKEFTVAEEM